MLKFKILFVPFLGKKGNQIPHRTLTYDKTGFKIVGTKVRLSISKNLRKWLKEKHGIELKYLWLETGLEIDEKLIKRLHRQK
jgi:putative transposase